MRENHWFTATPRETYVYDITEALLQIVESSGDRTKESSNKVEITTGYILDQHADIPSFHLEVNVKKWSDLKTDVLKITCARVDSEFLKQLFAFASERRFIQKGMLIPAGLYLMEEKDNDRIILQKYDNLISKMIGIPINGLTHSEINNPVGDSNKTARPQICG